MNQSPNVYLGKKNLNLPTYRVMNRGGAIYN